MTTTTSLITVRQLAEQLDLPVAWLNSAAVPAGIPCLRTGRSLLHESGRAELVRRARGVDFTIRPNATETQTQSRLDRKEAT